MNLIDRVIPFIFKEEEYFNIFVKVNSKFFILANRIFLINLIYNRER